MITPQFERYIAPARTYPQIWRLALGILVIIGIYLLGIAVLFAGISVFAGFDQLFYWGRVMSRAQTPTGMFLLFASFGGAALAPMIAVRLLHHRSVGSLFGQRVKVLRDFVTCAALVLVIYGVFMFFWSFWFTPVLNLDFGRWVLLLPLAMFGILVQTGAEELIFRGYLQQQLGARFRSPLIWMILPSALFASLHYSPGVAGENVWIVVAATGLYALIVADLTRITGSLGAAWGFHFANNVWAISFVALKGNITGLALFVTPYAASNTSDLPLLIAGDVLVMVFAWLLLRRLLQR